MNSDDLRHARTVLGHKWGLKRPLHMSELGRALGLKGTDPGQSVRDYQGGLTAIPPPVAELIAQFLSGAVPSRGLASIRPPKRVKAVLANTDRQKSDR